MSDYSGLSISGRIATPGDSDWDEARLTWNLAANQDPDAVAFVESADDVAAVLKFAAANELNVLGQSTGHGAVAAGAMEGTIVIKTERMRGVEVDADAESARVEAGVLALELGEAAQAKGLSYFPGSSPDVGVAGFSLGGGLGWLGRRYGFACNRITAIELVTADGEARTVDAESEPDLFWALRGGGGGYAIVTALHFALAPVAEVYGGTIVFPAAVGAEGFHAYRDWTETLPDEATTIGRFLRPPPLPDVPEPLRDTPLFTIGMAFIGDEDEGAKLFAPIRALGEPLVDMVQKMPAVGLSRIHMDPENPVPGLGHHRLIQELPDGAIDKFVDAVGVEMDSPLLLAELRQLGGALGRSAANAGALEKLDAAYALYAVGILASPEIGQAVEAKLDELHDAMDSWAAGGGYFNFAERSCEVEAILPADVCARLRTVKKQYDPAGLIRANHQLALERA